MTQTAALVERITMEADLRNALVAGQGFLFARPMDPADAEAYLRRTLQAFPLRAH